MRLHQTIEELETKDAYITHSLEHQMTYMKNLDLSSHLQTQAIANLSTVVKKFMIDSHGRFFETTRVVLWLNLTVHSQREVYMAVRQLEIALFQLTQQVDELLAAIQYTLQGKLPVTLIGPSDLHGIIRNLSLHLPKGYELVARTKQQNIFLYYDLITVAMVGDSHYLRLIMKIPLRTTEQLFSLYELIAPPARIVGDKFVKYSFEYPFSAFRSVGATTCCCQQPTYSSAPEEA